MLLGIAEDVWRATLRHAAAQADEAAETSAPPSETDLQRVADRALLLATIQRSLGEDRA